MTRYGSKQGACNNGHLGRPACGPPHDGKAKIDDELASSCLIEQGGKEDKEKDEGRGDTYGHSEYGMGRQEHMVDKNPQGG